MSWKKLLESVSDSLNDHIQLRNDYLIAENRILRHQIDGWVQLTDSERNELAEIGATLGTKALAEIATIATPDTILAWNRKFADQKVDDPTSHKSVGRPRIDPEIEDLVIHMVRENRSWGDDRIQGALNPLGYTLSDQTVGNILKRHRITPAPERKKTMPWREFTRSHPGVLLATDCFNRDLWGGLGFSIACLLGFVHFGCHQVHGVGMTRHRRTQTMGSCMRHAFSGPAQIERWGRWIKAFARLWAIRCGKRLPCNMLSEFPPDAERYPQPQDMGKVVYLSAARPRPIRDGPLHRRQRLGESLRIDSREAA